MRLIRVVLIACAMASAVADAQTPPPACAADEYQQFDFWLGDWQVTQRDGSVAGVNFIAKAYNGCVITEHYQVNGLPFGESLNAYDRVSKQWHQTWMDRNGNVLRLSGGIQGDSMVLSGSTIDSQGQPATHRITWTPQPDGTVIQHWQYKQDASTEWRTLFEGIYSRQAS